MNVSSRNAALVMLCQFLSPKLAKYDSKDLEFQAFQLFARGAMYNILLHNYNLERQSNLDTILTKLIFFLLLLGW